MIVACASVFTIHFGRAQPNNVESIDLQGVTDRLLAVQDEDVNYESLYENTVQILASPLDLNTVAADELRSLHVLTDEQIDNLMNWRNAYGPMLEVYELQAVPGFSRDVILTLLPFIKVIDPAMRLNKKAVRRIFTRGHGYIVTSYARTLEKKKGFTRDNDGFNGSPDKLYWRLRSSVPGDFSIGLTGEKDEGERLRFDRHVSQWGFDFTSFHIQLRDKGRLKNVIIGDFQTQFAQGLLLGGAFGIGKGGEQVSTIRRSTTGFHPYTSVNETAYLRGGAITIEVLRNIDVSLFYSSTRRDATGQEGDSSSLSIRATGLHRTKGELMGMKKLKERNTGAIIHYRKNNLDGGVIVNAIRFDPGLRKRPALYNGFAFAGKDNVNAGFFLNYRLGNIALFCEGGNSFGSGSGGIAGMLVSAHNNLDISMVYRNYERDFYAFYSNALAESTQPQNERGIYWAWKYRWNRRYSANGYADIFWFPWLGFRRYRPSGGFEWLLRGNYQPSRDVQIFLHIREESKCLNRPGSQNVYTLGERIRRNVSLHIDYGIGKNVRLKSRLQYNSQYFDKIVTEGWAFVQDISFQVGRFEFSGRHSLFDTDNYDNRHYVFERDTWSSYSMPVYSGVGVRNYALIEYKLRKNLTLWIRYARTRMLLGGEIGTGQDTIEGNTRNDVKFQAKLTF